MTKSTDIRTLKNLNNPTRYTIPDTKGLHLWVRSDQKKYWIYRFTFMARRFDMSLGSFPEITLSSARSKVQKLRGQILNGINPAEEKQAAKEKQKPVMPSITFKKFATEYIERMGPKWTNPKHADQWLSTVKTYAFPFIGHLSLEDITTIHVQDILTPIWNTKNETATRLRGRLERIISAAITSGLRKSSNPALWKGHLENLLPQIKRLQKHHAAIPYKDIPNLMIQLNGTKGLAALALQFTILNASRSGEVLYAKRSELQGNIWTIPPERMKARREHQVPLCSRSLELIEMAVLLDPESEFIFSRKGKHLSTMSMMMMLRKIRPGVTVHGARSSFRDFVAEETNHSPEVAEMALAHTIGNKVEAAYRRGKLLERRRILMQDWQDYCTPQIAQ